jgi:PIN domain nuclease of toxin-antitoxin system
MNLASLLIDTHFVLWLRLAPQYLTPGERNAMDGASVVYLSIASLWEIAILLGRGRIPNGTEQLLEVPIGLDLLPITPGHCKAAAKLPHHHGDPFDRMLVAQAQAEHIPLLTRDHTIAARYGGQATILRNPGP